MRLKRTALTGLGAVIAVTSLYAANVAAEGEQYFPGFTYRTGAYAPNGIPTANGVRDYYALLNERDGGINGVKIVYEECEFQYNTKQGVECYEKMKAKATVVFPFSTGVTYQLIPKASVDKVVIFSMGYGRTAAADGRVFPWAFNFPTTYWSQASAFIKYIGAQEGGMGNLKGKKVALIYHNSAYGKEPIPTFETLSKKFGYDFKLLAVDHPGQEQKATWLQIRRFKPDWIFLWGWGVMNQVAVKEAAAINYPMDHFVGVWWSGSENDVIPAGDGAIGYKAGTFHGVGGGYPIHKDITKHVYGGDAGKAKENNVGEVPLQPGHAERDVRGRGVRAAMARWGNKPMTGEQVRWGLENLHVTEKRLTQLGMGGFTKPVEVSCEDHETMGPVLIQQWDGKQWKIVSDWIKPMRDVVRPMVEKAAAEYAKENNITPRDCSKES